MKVGSGRGGYRVRSIKRHNNIRGFWIDLQNHSMKTLWGLKFMLFRYRIRNIKRHNDIRGFWIDLQNLGLELEISNVTAVR